MTKNFRNIALFGANGQIGRHVLTALMDQEEEFKVVAFVSPNSNFKANDFGKANIIECRLDLNSVNCEDIARIMIHEHVGVAISTLGREVITKQGVIQDAAAKAGVRRFYPSEYGMHQIPWFADEGPYLHPTWATKMKCLDDAIKHPAIQSGQMTYTVIGCAELYDVQDEPILCPWLSDSISIAEGGYEVQCVGDPNAKMDYSSCSDVAKYLVASIMHPERSENKILGFRSDYISHNEVTQLLRKHSKRQARINLISIDQVKEILKDPSSAPEKLQGGSTFPVDFWVLLRYVQGQGKFWRPPGLLSNDLFPEVTPTSLDKYFEGLFFN